MKEHNKKTLIEALSTLPEHEPPDAIWNVIEAKIEEPSEEKFLPEEVVAALPMYDPPTMIWGNIARILDKEGRGGAKIIPLRWKQAMAVAASLALMLLALHFFGKPMAEPGTISYSSETVDPLLVSKDWDMDEHDFNQFHALCESKKFICELPQFQQLKDELDELTEAKEAIKSAIGNYGADPNMVLQIKDIELERTGLLKKMMGMLI